MVQALLVMLLPSFILILWSQKSGQNVCTDLGKFRNLGNSYKPVGPSMDSCVVAGLLHCVHKCNDWPGCQAFAFNTRNQTCRLHSGYDVSPSDQSTVNRDVVYSIIKVWPGIYGISEKKTEATKLNRGYDCSIQYRDKCRRFYKGSLNVSRSGTTCQRWDRQTPQRHVEHGNLNAHFANTGESVATAANYCRMLMSDNETVPWCYTMNPDIRWEFCNVSVCPV